MARQVDLEFGQMLVEVSDYIGTEKRRKIMTVLGWPEGIQDRMVDSLMMLNEMVNRQVFTETNITELVRILNGCNAVHAANKAKEYIPRLSPNLARSVQNFQQTAENRSASTKKVFISYKGSAEDKVMEIKDRIDAAFPDKVCWTYNNEIMAGQHIDERITEGMNNASVLLCMINRDYPLSTECRKEVSLAEEQQKYTIFVRIDGAPWPPTDVNGEMSSLMATYSRKSYCNLYQDDPLMVQREFDRLIAAIKANI